MIIVLTNLVLEMHWDFMAVILNLFVVVGLGAVYEVCRLGSHMPSGAAAAGQSVPMASSGKQTLPGFTVVDIAGVSHSSAAARGEFFNASNYSLAKAFAADMSSNWNMSEFRKSLVKVCKELSLPSGSQREPEQGPCTVS